jgi:7-alpha-hydroxysteroid dehydrogenase
MRAAAGRAAAMARDVTKEADPAAAVDRTADPLGGLSILVNKAAGGGPRPFDMAMDDMRRAFGLDLFPVFRLCRRAAPPMEAVGGGTVMIADLDGDRTPGRPPGSPRRPARRSAAWPAP